MKDLPFATNFQRFSMYMLAPDEIVLFEWFLSKQYYFGVHSHFHYSKPRIEADTKISRRRLEAIIKKFEGLGVLEKILEVKRDGCSMTNHYKVDFEALMKDDVLSRIVEKDSVLFTDYKKYFDKVCPF